MLMLIFKALAQIVALVLFVMGAVHGIVDHDYPLACFEILLAYGCRGDL